MLSDSICQVRCKEQVDRHCILFEPGYDWISAAAPNPSLPIIKALDTPLPPCPPSSPYLRFIETIDSVGMAPLSPSNLL